MEDMEDHFSEKERVYSDRLVKRLYRNIQGIHLQTQLKMNADVFHRTPICASYKKLKCSQLTVQQQIDMVQMVVVLKEHHKDVAAAFGVDTGLVYRLVTKARLDPLYLQKKLEKQRR